MPRVLHYAYSIARIEAEMSGAENIIYKDLHFFGVKKLLATKARE
jgi:hypothetical protein